jgi:arsenate reductase (glutaredoxin)
MTDMEDRANTPAIILYGIPNCDSVKKAMVWLKKNKIDYSFHDYKTAGISEKKLLQWCRQTDWQLIFNKRSTTYKALPEKLQKQITDSKTAIPVMIEHNSIIKRPIIEAGNKIIVGYDEAACEEILK